MIHDEKLFGSYLRELLGERPASWLADKLDVDGAEVRRWLRNERVPRHNSPYLHGLTRVLRLNVKQQETLRNAHQNALRLSPAERAARRAATQAATNVSAFLAIRRTPVAILERADQGLPISVERRMATMPPLAGSNDALDMVVKLLLQIAEQRVNPSPANTIWITSQAERPIDDDEDAHARWKAAIYRVLKAGYNVCHLIRLEKRARGSADDSRRLMQDTLDFVTTRGAYSPWYFAGEMTQLWPYNLVIPPGDAGLLLLTTDDSVPGRTDAVIPIHGKENVEKLRAHCERLRNAAQPLLIEYPTTSLRERLRYLEVLVAAERSPGERFLIQDSFAQATRPRSWYKMGTEWTNNQCNGDDRALEDPEFQKDLKEVIRLRREQRDVFYDALRRNDRYDIYPQRRVREMLTEGRYTKSTAFQDKRLMRAYLRDFMEFLRDDQYRFHCALIDEDEEKEFMARVQWEVMDNKVFLETHKKRVGSPQSTLVQLQVNESSLVQTFQDFAAACWQRIDPLHKTREYVIRFIEDELSRTR